MGKQMRVLADGCFDPVHEGHVAYLNAAAAEGDYLIVNMATDREIWEKRPKVGPFLPEAVRKNLLENLKPVSKVVVWDTKEALEKERPDIYVKGSDWRGRLPEAEQSICDRLGIKVVFLDTVTNSSSRLLEKFLEQAKAHQYE